MVKFRKGGVPVIHRAPDKGRGEAFPCRKGGTKKVHSAEGSRPSGRGRSQGEVDASFKRGKGGD